MIVLLSLCINANNRLFPALALLYSGFLLVAPSVRQMLLRLDILECWHQFFIKDDFVFFLRSRAAHQSGALSALDQVNIKYERHSPWALSF